MIDRGISGQTTSQMLLRFQQDVIALQPKSVVILAGINDIAQNAGPISVPQIFDNIKSMVDLAKANKASIGEGNFQALFEAIEFHWMNDLSTSLVRSWKNVLKMLLT